MDYESETITILNEEYEVIYDRISIDELRYYPQNPRVAGILNERGINPADESDSEKIQMVLDEVMLAENSVKNLIPDIRRHGGVMDDLLVDYQNNQVIEGNSRLAAMRKLNKDDSGKWGNNVPCKLVKGLTPEAIDSYLEQQHGVGKTSWLPFEKANKTYQRVVVEEKYSVEKYSGIIGKSVGELEKRIEIIQLMYDNEERRRDRFSYYDVILRKKAIADEFKRDPRLEEFILRTVKKDSLDFTAQDLRKKLPVIISSKKHFKKLLDEKLTLKEAYDLAKKIKPIEKIKDARKKIQDIHRPEIEKAQNSDLNALEIEIKKCRKDLNRIADMVDEVRNDRSN